MSSLVDFNCNLYLLKALNMYTFDVKIGFCYCLIFLDCQEPVYRFVTDLMAASVGVFVKVEN